MVTAVVAVARMAKASKWLSYNLGIDVRSRPRSRPFQRLAVNGNKHSGLAMTTFTTPAEAAVPTLIVEIDLMPGAVALCGSQINEWASVAVAGNVTEPAFVR